MGRMASTDIQPPTTLRAVLSYVGKYVSKTETSLASYAELQAQVLRDVDDQASLLSIVSCMLNRGRPARRARRRVRRRRRLTLSLAVVMRSPGRHRLWQLAAASAVPFRLPLPLRLDDLKASSSCHPSRHQLLSPATSTILPWTPIRPTTASVQLPLRRLGRPDVRRRLHLRVVVDAFRTCVRLHDHPEDLYTDPAPQSDESASDSDYETDDSLDLDPVGHQLAEFEVSARGAPHDDLVSARFVVNLGAPDLDYAYDWSSHVGHCVAFPDVWPCMKVENPATQLVVVDSSPVVLNPRRQADKLAPLNPFKLFLNVDGVSGSRKRS